jgi:ABC-type glycerol-3-phosphate transport system substrate-binding protein
MNWIVRKGNALKLNQALRNLIAVLMLAVFIFAGCQGQDLLQSVFPKDEAVTAAPDETRVPAGVNPPDFAKSPSPPSFYDLVIWVPPQFDPNSDSEAGKLLGARIQDFLQENPAVNLNVRVKAASGPGGLLESLDKTRDVAPIAVPSLVLITRSEMIQAVEKNLLFPIKGTSTAIDDNDWYDFSREMGIYSGTVYGLPFSSNALGLVFRDMKLVQNSMSWEDSFRIFDTFVFPAGASNALVPLSMYASAGGKIGNQQDIHPINPEILESILDVIDTGARTGVLSPVISELKTDEQSWEYFETGGYDAVITWVNRFLSADENFHLAPMPSIGKNPHTFASGWAWCLTDLNKENHEYVISLAEYLIDTDFLSQWAPLSGYLPVRPSSMEKWIDGQNGGTISGILFSAVLIPDQSDIDGINTEITTVVVEVLTRQVSPAVGALRAFERVEANDSP